MSWINLSANSLREEAAQLFFFFFLHFAGHREKSDYVSLQVAIIPYSKGIECDLGLRVREMNF